MRLEKKEIITIVFLFILGAGFTYFYQNYFSLNDENDSLKNVVCFSDVCFFVEIVNDNVNRTKGLMFRESLEDNKGMLFIFDEEGRYPFWMKNTLIPLDIVWINSNKEIVYIQEEALPCEKNPCQVYDPGVDSLYVLEINAGKAAEIDLKIGDFLRYG